MIKLCLKVGWKNLAFDTSKHSNKCHVFYKELGMYTWKNHGGGKT